MAGQVGAAVVLNPPTGSVLGLWSAPQFDPNHLSSHDLIAVTSDYQALSSDPNQPLLNRAEFQSYDIGSLFTIVTAAAAIEEELRDFVVPPISPGHRTFRRWLKRPVLFVNGALGYPHPENLFLCCAENRSLFRGGHQQSEI